MAARFLATGQQTCFDVAGREIPCVGTGQDAEFARGLAGPEPRFDVRGEEVLDRFTGLSWLRDAAFIEYPLSWQEALDQVDAMNSVAIAGRSDWRLPNRRELRSLVSHGVARPALPQGYPFIKVVRSWYWSSTSAAGNPAYAWYVNLDGARMFYGAKDQYFMLWPVRDHGQNILPATGQQLCFDHRGAAVNCRRTGQDGELRLGAAWPENRLKVFGDVVRDQLTGLEWLRHADLADGSVSWGEALAAVKDIGASQSGDNRSWRLPNINELESLVDCAAASPALPAGHPFAAVQEAYWSSTTSVFEPDWAWALYLDKGACGVGRKEGRYFSVWPVRDFPAGIS